MAVSVSPAAGVGEKLKEARAGRGVSVQEAALKTRIHPRYLHALEHDAPPGAFRAPVYARAFLREYASFLGLDPEPLVAAYREAHGDREAFAQLSRRRPVERRGSARVMSWTLATISTAVLVALAVLSSREPGDLQIPPPEPATSRVLPNTPAEEAVAPVDPSAFEGVWLEIRVRHAPSWIRVTREGATVIEGEREPGFTRVVRAPERLRVRVRNAGAVVFFLGDRRIGTLGRWGETAAASFVFEDGRARVIRSR